ncbi:hypothetical protein TrVE_jg12172 [Triparma verrucosa]|uniref:NADH dehydrogenase [ubiquinone] 1 alpha subcomplex subunit 13 n=2 Tax=Triparma TaxID=722752 RepID=A0A9W7BKT5_9STRA|nr:hypothetical protein TrST_g1363 [Triparma strigata]GMH93746.1 hypothetical protein TrVE_jg12172 [Triparma verrucosa]|mmetsp:Transcript_9403/g.17086  ORF Transcript_9403/g.17086 Transcript_9403/m.17086 type:complete len:138 (-) Transcript_9403:29-442(-)|eukprot:CAMPEP_0182500174 /NCGR_PEP_ID=MMETSP1321-20130603/8566_1 /TAXON_ID=91990 /ORGANISM="Bolidomonas sp., Strain RCC1657" /LENGTH=137 /DNA_ID=CAMNT_0024704523 /DNA_START=112 /DNA_END=525 /DNA_ORIENTATION=-
MSDPTSGFGLGTRVLGRSAPVQDLPPKGGYPSINSSRSIPARGPSGAKIWLAGALVSGFGFYLLGMENTKRNADKAEKREARLSLYPYLQAESDRSYVKSEISQLKEEADLMKGVKGWKVGENVYNSKKWMPPPTHI